MDAKDKSDGYMWRCGTKKCRRKLSFRAETWFSKSKLGIPMVVVLTYCWTQRYPTFILEHELGLSRTTIVDWRNFAREVCSVIRSKEEAIGGPGFEIEIDESKFGKQKEGGRSLGVRWVAPQY